MIRLRRIYSFGMGRRANKLANSFRKDYTKLQATQLELKKEKGDAIRLNNIATLTEALDQARKPVYRKVHFTVPQTLNLHLKSQLKKAIDKQIPGLQAQAREALEDKTLKWNENQLMGEEAKKFAKVYFEKKETQRLQLKETKRPSNYLSAESLKDEPYMFQLNQEHARFAQNVNHLQGLRLDSFLERSNSAELLKLLVGLEEPVRQRVLSFTQRLITQPSGTQQNPLALTNQQSIDSVVDEIVGGTSVDRNQMLQVITSLIDRSAQTTQRFEDHVNAVTQVQQYQKFVFDEFRNKDMNLRYEGKLEFWMLTETEQLRYIKYNLPFADLVLKAVKTFSMYKEVSIKVYPQLLQQLSTFKPQKYIQYLGLIKDKQFPFLIKQISLNLHNYDDQTFVSTIFAIGKMHPQTQALIYRRMHLKFYPTLLQEILTRLPQLPKDQLALLVRNLGNFPFIVNQQLQVHLLNAISVFDPKSLTLFEGESFLTLVNKSHSYLLTDQLAFITKVIEQVASIQKDFDQISLQILNQAIIKVYSISHNPICLQIVKNMDLDYILQTMPLKNIAQFSSMLACINYPRNDNKVTMMKKRLIDLITWKNQEIYDVEIAQVIMSMAKLDSQTLYKNLNVYDKLALQGCFQFRVFQPKSVFYIPYTKMMKALESDLSNFSIQAKLSVIKSMALIGHGNKDAVTHLIHSIIGYDPLQPKLEVRFDADVETIGHIIQVMSQYNQIDELFVRLMIQGLDDLQVHEGILKFDTIVQYLQATFAFQIRNTDVEVLNTFALRIIENLKEYGQSVSPTQRLCAFYYLLAISCSKHENYSPEIEEAIELLQESLKGAKDFIFESRYLITLIQLLGEPGMVSSGLSNEQTKEFLQHMYQKEQETLTQVGTERYTKDQGINLIQSDFTAMGFSIKKGQFLELDGIVYDRADLSLDDTYHFKMISLSQLVDNVQLGQKQLRGQEEVIKMLTPRLNYIIVEDYNRACEDLFENPNATKEFLQMYIKQ